MFIKIANVKPHLTTLDIDPLTGTGQEALSNLLLGMLPTCQAWYYDPETDTLEISFVVIVPTRLTVLGEVIEDGFILG